MIKDTDGEKRADGDGDKIDYDGHRGIKDGDEVQRWKDTCEVGNFHSKVFEEEKPRRLRASLWAW